jgi:hypothetical protein
MRSEKVSHRLTAKRGIEGGHGAFTLNYMSSVISIAMVHAGGVGDQGQSFYGHKF